MAVDKLLTIVYAASRSRGFIPSDELFSHFEKSGGSFNEYDHALCVLEDIGAVRGIGSGVGRIYITKLGVMLGEWVTAGIHTLEID